MSAQRIDIIQSQSTNTKLIDSKFVHSSLTRLYQHKCSPLPCYQLIYRLLVITDKTLINMSYTYALSNRTPLILPSFAY